MFPCAPAGERLGRPNQANEPFKQIEGTDDKENAPIDLTKGPPKWHHWPPSHEGIECPLTFSSPSLVLDRIRVGGNLTKTMLDYDIVIVGDLRFPGGTSTGICEEIKANFSAGYRTGLVHVRGPVLKFPHPINPKIRRLIDQGSADLLDPDEPLRVRLACIHHPQVFSNQPLRSLRIEAEKKLLVVWHPPLDGAGDPSYDWAKIDQHVQDAMGGEVFWSPTGPAVRAQLEAMSDPPPLYGGDWHGVIDPAQWSGVRTGFVEERPVIGRHSRPDALKWPDTREEVLAAYPDDPSVAVRILGEGPFLEDLLGSCPSNWELWPYDSFDPAEFLSKIDYFVYFHSRRWVEAFGFVIIEAMASGAVPVLAPHFQDLFGKGAVYSEIAHVRDLVGAIHGDTAEFRRLSQAAVSCVHENFSHEVHQRRVLDLIGPPAKVQVSRLTQPRKQPRRVLFLTSNGVGMGHLTRMMAVAKRCPDPIQPVFITMSQAIQPVQDAGWIVEHIPFHSYLESDVNLWNHYLRQEINERIDFYESQVLIFDGNVPYTGLVAAINDHPTCTFVWCRRAMWTAGSGDEHVARETNFHAVIEPLEIATQFDKGSTTTHRDRTRRVDPIRLLDDHEQLPQREARLELGLEPEVPAALLLLGSGNNFDMTEVRDLVVRQLVERSNLQLAAVDWMISERRLELPQGVRRLSVYPISRYLRAFDFAVSAAGYNSYHELILSGIPTIFVPNEHPMMDDQLARARFADLNGLGFCLRAHEVYRVAPVVEKILDEDVRAGIVSRCSTLEFENGAVEVATFLEELVYGARADIDQFR